MRRREFVAGLVAAAAWPLVAPAQDRAPPIDVIVNALRNNPEAHARLDRFMHGLRQRADKVIE